MAQCILIKNVETINGSNNLLIDYKDDSLCNKSFNNLTFEFEFKINTHTALNQLIFASSDLAGTDESRTFIYVDSKYDKHLFFMYYLGATQYEIVSTQIIKPNVIYKCKIEFTSNQVIMTVNDKKVTQTHPNGSIKFFTYNTIKTGVPYDNGYYGPLDGEIEKFILKKN